MDDHVPTPPLDAVLREVVDQLHTLVNIGDHRGAHELVAEITARFAIEQARIDG